MLTRAFGEETSFEEIKVDTIPARELQYEVDHFHDEAHNGYHGVAVFVVLKDKVYTANAIMAKDAGKEDLKKFRDSIKIKHSIETKSK